MNDVLADLFRTRVRLPPSPPPDEVYMLEFTPTAIDKIMDMIYGEKDLEEAAVRVAVVGGGCSGYSYDIGFIDSKNDDDELYEFENVTVYVDPMSMQYLNNTTIDYVESFNYSGFHFDNPNAKRTCGCGASFGL